MMETIPMPIELVITDADRQAACDLIGTDTYGKPHWTVSTISDHNRVVQAFAKHRLAALRDQGMTVSALYGYEAGLIEGARAHGAEFQRADRVRKVEGYPFGDGDAVVLVAYRCAEGKGPWRYVVEHPEGWQHIFSGKQLALSEKSDDRA